jgi:hypothetical protein
LAEGQYSQKRFTFENFGGTSTSLVDSPFFTLTQDLAHYNAPYFDATDPEDRNNRQFLATATYFGATNRFGSHQIKGGIESFTSTNTGGNSQSATGYAFDADLAVDAGGRPVLDASGRLIPVFVPDESLIEIWQAVRGAKIDIRTTSVYANDNWQLNDRWSFNVGARFEDVRSDATGNIVGVNTATVVPRLGTTFDLRGDGRYVIGSTYGHYAGKYSEAQFARNTNVGTPDFLLGVYVGPPGEGRAFAPGFDPANYETVYGEFPTANVRFDDDLRSPVTKEFTLSGGGAVGRGHVKATYIRRHMSSFVEDFVDTTTGATTVVRAEIDFGTFDNIVYRNSDEPTRAYQGLDLLGRFRASEHWLVDGSWTIQIENDGNFEGEAANQPATSSPIGDYPELFNMARHYPIGRLDGFQRHKVRLLSVYTLGGGPLGTLDIGTIWRYNSARTYSLVAVGQPLSFVQDANAAAAGYSSWPVGQDVYFGGRGTQQFRPYSLVDLSFHHGVPVWRDARPWIKLEIFNIFNSNKLIAWQTTVDQDPLSAPDPLGLATGFVKDVQFGQGTSTSHYPPPIPGETGGRTIRLSFGFRL